ncbi:toxin glutamine deamidase domain-containing protein [Nocardia sp. NPDC057353]|uniref:toxin glutamine deamidase domain-containing protein n=1 Tax=Nocardia sp. NPDC057353 TaxID=3346104 RepID=UPI00362E0FEC
MSIEIPPELQWLSYLAGASWPQGDEDQLFALSQDWTDAATALTAVIPLLRTATDTATQNYSGEGAEQMVAQFQNFFSGDSSIEKIAEGLEGLAKAAFDCGTQVEYAKLQIVITLAVMAIEILWALASAWGAWTVPIIEAAGMGVMSQIAARLASHMASRAAKMADMPLWKMTGIEILQETALGLGIEGLAQGIQLAKGTREDFDTTQFLVSGAVSGFAAGVAAPIGHLGGKYLGGVVSKHGEMTWWKGGLIGIGAGIPAGLVGATASMVGYGAITGQWEFDPAALAGGVAGGIAGGMHGVSGYFQNQAVAAHQNLALEGKSDEKDGAPSDDVLDDPPPPYRDGTAPQVGGAPTAPTALTTGGQHTGGGLPGQAPAEPASTVNGRTPPGPVAPGRADSTAAQARPAPAPRDYSTAAAIADGSSRSGPVRTDGTENSVSRANVAPVDATFAANGTDQFRAGSVHDANSVSTQHDAQSVSESRPGTAEGVRSADPPLAAQQEQRTPLVAESNGGDRLDSPIQEGDPLRISTEQNANPLHDITEQNGSPLQSPIEQNGDPLHDVVDQNGNPLQTSTDPNSSPLQSPTEQNGNPLQSPTEQNGNPLQSVTEQQNGDPFHDAVEQNDEPPLTPVEGGDDPLQVDDRDGDGRISEEEGALGQPDPEGAPLRPGDEPLAPEFTDRVDPATLTGDESTGDAPLEQHRIGAESSSQVLHHLAAGFPNSGVIQPPTAPTGPQGMDAREFESRSGGTLLTFAGPEAVGNALRELGPGARAAVIETSPGPADRHGVGARAVVMSVRNDNPWVWDPATGKQSPLVFRGRGDIGAVTAVLYHPDGRPAGGEIRTGLSPTPGAPASPLTAAPSTPVQSSVTADQATQLPRPGDQRGFGEPPADPAPPKRDPGGYQRHVTAQEHAERHQQQVRQTIERSAGSVDRAGQAVEAAEATGDAVLITEARAVHTQAVADHRETVEAAVDDLMAAAKTAGTDTWQAFQDGQISRDDAFPLVRRERVAAAKAAAEALLAHYEIQAGKDRSGPLATLSPAELEQRVLTGSEKDSRAAQIELFRRGTGGEIGGPGGKVLRWTQLTAEILMHHGPVEMDTGEGKELTAISRATRTVLETGIAHVMTSSDPLVVHMQHEFENLVAGDRGLGIDVYRLDSDQPFPERVDGRRLIVVGTAQDYGFRAVKEAQAVVDRLTAAGMPTAELTQLRAELEAAPSLREYTELLDAAAAKFDVSERFQPFPGGNLIIDEIDAQLIDEQTHYVLSPGKAGPATDAFAQRVHEIWGTLREAEQRGVLGPADFGKDPERRGIFDSRLTPEGRARLADMLGPDRPISDADAAEFAHAAQARWGPERDSDYHVSADGKIKIIASQTNDQVMDDPEKQSSSRWNGFAKYLEAMNELAITADSQHSLSITGKQIFTGGHFEHITGMSGTLLTPSEGNPRGVEDAMHSEYGTGPIAKVDRYFKSQLSTPDARHFLSGEEKFAAMADDILDTAFVRNAETGELEQQGSPQLAIAMDNADVARLSAALDRAAAERGIVVAYDKLDVAWVDAHGSKDRANDELQRIIAGGGEMGRIILGNKMMGRGVDITPSAEAIANGGLKVKISGGPAYSERVNHQAETRAARSGNPKGDWATGGTPGEAVHYVSPEDYRSAAPDARVTTYITRYQEAAADHRDAAAAHRDGGTGETEARVEQTRSALATAENDLRDIATPLQKAAVEQQLLRAHTLESDLPRAPPTTEGTDSQRPATPPPIPRTEPEQHPADSASLAETTDTPETTTTPESTATPERTAPLETTTTPERATTPETTATPRRPAPITDGTGVIGPEHRTDRGSEEPVVTPGTLDCGVLALRGLADLTGRPQPRLPSTETTGITADTLADHAGAPLRPFHDHDDIAAQLTPLGPGAVALVVDHYRGPADTTGIGAHAYLLRVGDDGAIEVRDPADPDTRAFPPHAPRELAGTHAALFDANGRPAFIVPQHPEELPAETVIGHRPLSEPVLEFGAQRRGAEELVHVMPIPQRTIEWLRGHVVRMVESRGGEFAAAQWLREVRELTPDATPEQIRARLNTIDADDTFKADVDAMLSTGPIAARVDRLLGGTKPVETAGAPDPKFRAEVERKLTSRLTTAEYDRLLSESGMPLAVEYRGRPFPAFLRLQLRARDSSRPSTGPTVSTQRWTYGAVETGDTAGSHNLRSFGLTFSGLWNMFDKTFLRMGLTFRPDFTHNELSSGASVFSTIQSIIKKRSTEAAAVPHDYEMLWEIRLNDDGVAGVLAPDLPVADGWTRIPEPAPDDLVAWFPKYLDESPGLPVVDPADDATVPPPQRRDPADPDAPLSLEELPFYGPLDFPHHDRLFADVMASFPDQVRNLSSNSASQLREFFGGNFRGNIPMMHGGAVPSPTLYAKDGTPLGFFQVEIPAFHGGQQLTGPTTTAGASRLEYNVLRALRTLATSTIANAIGGSLALSFGLGRAKPDEKTSYPTIGANLTPVKVGAAQRHNHSIAYGGRAYTSRALRLVAHLLHTTPDLDIRVTFVRPGGPPVQPQAGSPLAPANPATDPTPGKRYPINMLVPSKASLGSKPTAEQRRYLPPDLLHLQQLGLLTTPLRNDIPQPVLDGIENYLADKNFLPPRTEGSNTLDSDATKSQLLENHRKLTQITSRLNRLGTVDEMIQGGSRTVFEKSNGFDTERITVTIKAVRDYATADGRYDPEQNAHRGVTHDWMIPHIQTMNYSGIILASEERSEHTPFAWDAGAGFAFTNPFDVEGSEALASLNGSYDRTGDTSQTTVSGHNLAEENYTFSPGPKAREPGLQIFGVPTRYVVEIAYSHGPGPAPIEGTGAISLAVPTYLTTPTEGTGRLPDPVIRADTDVDDDARAEFTEKLGLAADAAIEKGVGRLPLSAVIAGHPVGEILHEATLELVADIEREAAAELDDPNRPPLPGEYPGTPADSGTESEAAPSTTAGSRWNPGAYLPSGPWSAAVRRWFGARAPEQESIELADRDTAAPPFPAPPDRPAPPPPNQLLPLTSDGEVDITDLPHPETFLLTDGESTLPGDGHGPTFLLSDDESGRSGGRGPTFLDSDTESGRPSAAGGPTFPRTDGSDEFVEIDLTDVPRPTLLDSDDESDDTPPVPGAWRADDERSDAGDTGPTWSDLGHWVWDRAAGLGRWMWRTAFGDPVQHPTSAVQSALHTSLSPHHTTSFAPMIFRDSFKFESEIPGGVAGTDYSVDIRGYFDNIEVLGVVPIDTEHWLENTNTTADTETKTRGNAGGINVQGAYGAQSDGSFRPSGGWHGFDSTGKSVTKGDATDTMRVTSDYGGNVYRFTADGHYRVNVKVGLRNFLSGLAQGKPYASRTRFVDAPRRLEFFLTDNDLHNHPEYLRLVQQWAADNKVADPVLPEETVQQSDGTSVATERRLLPDAYAGARTDDPETAKGLLSFGSVTEVVFEDGRGALEDTATALVEKMSPGATVVGSNNYHPGVATLINEHTTSFGVRNLANAGSEGKHTFHYIDRSGLFPKLVGVNFSTRPRRDADMPDGTTLATLEGKQVPRTAALDNVHRHIRADGNALLEPEATSVGTTRSRGNQLDVTFGGRSTGTETKDRGHRPAVTFGVERSSTHGDVQNSTRDLSAWQRSSDAQYEFEVPTEYTVTVDSRPLTEALLTYVADKVGDLLILGGQQLGVAHGLVPEELPPPTVTESSTVRSTSHVRLHVSDTKPLPGAGSVPELQRTRPAIFGFDPAAPELRPARIRDTERPADEIDLEANTHVEPADEVPADTRALLSTTPWVPELSFDIREFDAAPELAAALLTVDPALHGNDGTRSAEATYNRLVTLVAKGDFTRLGPQSTAPLLNVDPSGTVPEPRPHAAEVTVDGVQIKVSLYSPRAEDSATSIAIDRFEFSVDSMLSSEEHSTTVGLGASYTGPILSEQNFRGGIASLPIGGQSQHKGGDNGVGSVRRNLWRTNAPTDGFRLRTVALVEVRGPQGTVWVTGDMVLRTIEPPPSTAKTPEPADSTAAPKSGSNGTEGKAADGKAADGKAAEGKAAEVKADEGTTAEGKAAEGKAAEGKAAGVEAGAEGKARVTGSEDGDRAVPPPATFRVAGPRSAAVESVPAPEGHLWESMPEDNDCFFHALERIVYVAPAHSRAELDRRLHHLRGMTADELSGPRRDQYFRQFLELHAAALTSGKRLTAEERRQTEIPQHIVDSARAAYDAQVRRLRQLGQWQFTLFDLVPRAAATALARLNVGLVRVHNTQIAHGWTFGEDTRAQPDASVLVAGEHYYLAVPADGTGAPKAPTVPDGRSRVGDDAERPENAVEPVKTRPTVEGDSSIETGIDEATAARAPIGTDQQTAETTTAAKPLETNTERSGQLASPPVRRRHRFDPLPRVHRAVEPLRNLPSGEDLRLSTPVSAPVRPDASVESIATPEVSDEAQAMNLTVDTALTGDDRSTAAPGTQPTPPMTPHRAAPLSDGSIQVNATTATRQAGPVRPAAPNRLQRILSRVRALPERLAGAPTPRPAERAPRHRDLFRARLDRLRGAAPTPDPARGDGTVRTASPQLATSPESATVLPRTGAPPITPDAGLPEVTARSGASTDVDSVDTSRAGSSALRTGTDCVVAALTGIRDSLPGNRIRIPTGPPPVAGRTRRELERAAGGRLQGFPDTATIVRNLMIQGPGAQALVVGVHATPGADGIGAHAYRMVNDRGTVLVQDDADPTHTVPGRNEYAAVHAILFGPTGAVAPALFPPGIGRDDPRTTIPHIPTGVRTLAARLRTGHHARPLPDSRSDTGVSGSGTRTGRTIPVFPAGIRIGAPADRTRPPGRPDRGPEADGSALHPATAPAPRLGSRRLGRVVARVQGLTGSSAPRASRADTRPSTVDRLRTLMTRGDRTDPAADFRTPATGHDTGDPTWTPLPENGNRLLDVLARAAGLPNGRAARTTMAEHLRADRDAYLELLRSVTLAAQKEAKGETLRRIRWRNEWAEGELREIGELLELRRRGVLGSDEDLPRSAADIAATAARKQQFLDSIDRFDDAVRERALDRFGLLLDALTDRHHPTDHLMSVDLLPVAARALGLNMVVLRPGAPRDVYRHGAADAPFVLVYASPDNPADLQLATTADGRPYRLHLDRLDLPATFDPPAEHHTRPPTPSSTDRTDTGRLDPSGTRVFDTEDAGLNYGETVLDRWPQLTAEQKHAVWAYHLSPAYNTLLRDGGDALQRTYERQRAAAANLDVLTELTGSQDPSLDDLAAYHTGPSHPSDVLPDPARAYQATRALQSIFGTASPSATHTQLVADGRHYRQITEPLYLRYLGSATPHPFTLRRAVDTLDRAMQPLPNTEPIRVVRGIDQIEFLRGRDGRRMRYPYALDDLVGTTQHEPGYLSTTVGPDLATMGDGREFSYRLDLTVPPGTPGLWIGSNGGQPRDSELLLARDTRYRITGVARDEATRLTTITAEVLLPGTAESEPAGPGTDTSTAQPVHTRPTPGSRTIAPTTGFPQQAFGSVDTADQQALEAALAAPGGGFARYRNPATYTAVPGGRPFGRLVNGPGTRLLGRLRNCAATTVAAISSFLGSPVVAGPLIGPLPEHPALAGNPATERWLGNQLVDPATFTERPAPMAEQFRMIQDVIADRGTGSFAFVCVEWGSVDADGNPVTNGNAHILAIVHPEDAPGPVWWDAQTGRTYETMPAAFVDRVARVRFAASDIALLDRAASHRGLLEDALRSADGSGFVARRDPGRYSSVPGGPAYGTLTTFGGPPGPGRTHSGYDAALAGIASFLGFPRTNVPSWDRLNPGGAPQRVPRTDRVRLRRVARFFGRQWQSMDDGRPVGERFDHVTEVLASAGYGPGSVAVVEARQQDGSVAVLAVVHPEDGSRAPVWWDPLTGYTGDRVPESIAATTVAVSYVAAPERELVGGSPRELISRSAPAFFADPSHSHLIPTPSSFQTPGRYGPVTEAETRALRQALEWNGVAVPFQNPATAYATGGIPYGRLIAGSDPTAGNAPARVLALFSSFLGNPEVARPLIGPADTAPENSDEAQAERWLGAEQVSPGPERTAAEQYRAVYDAVRGSGERTMARVGVRWNDTPGAETGRPVEDHVLALVFPDAESDPVWWDPADGATYTELPASIVERTAATSAIITTPDRVVLAAGARRAAANAEAVAPVPLVPAGAQRSPADDVAQPVVRQIEAGDPSMRTLEELHRRARWVAQVTPNRMGAALEYRVGDLSGSFAAFSGGKPWAPRRRGLPGEPPVIAPPATDNAIVPLHRDRPKRSTDSENNLLEHLHRTLVAAYPLGPDGTSPATGHVRVFVEQTPCDSCAEVIERFQQMYPHIDLEVGWVAPYPPLDLERPTLGLPQGVIPRSGRQPRTQAGPSQPRPTQAGPSRPAPSSSRPADTSSRPADDTLRPTEDTFQPADTGHGPASPEQFPEQLAEPSAPLTAPAVRQIDMDDPSVYELAELHRQARYIAQVTPNRMGAALEYRVGDLSGSFAGFSGGKAWAPRRRGLPYTAPEIAPPATDNAIIPLHRDRPKRSTDSENNILEHLHRKLVGTYPLGPDGTSPATGHVRVLVEQTPCDSCAEVIERFQQMYPHIDLQVGWVVPYPPLDLDRPTLGLPHGVVPKSGRAGPSRAESATQAAQRGSTLRIPDPADTADTGHGMAEEQHAGSSAEGSAPAVRQVRVDDPAVHGLAELHRRARYAAQVGPGRMGGALEYEIGSETGAFAAFSGAKVWGVQRRSLPWPVPEIALPVTDHAIVPAHRDKPGRATDSENNLLEHLHRKLIETYPLGPDGTSPARGRVRMFVEHAPCDSCAEVIERFQQMYPHIHLESLWVAPYPPLDLERPTLGLPGGVAPKKGKSAKPKDPVPQPGSSSGGSGAGR